MTEYNNHRLHMLAAFASGGLICAGIALLLAPQSGRETRRSLTRWGRIAQKKSRRLRSDLNHKMDRAFAEIQDSFQAHLEDGKAWTEERKNEVENVLQSGKKYIEKEVSRILAS